MSDERRRGHEELIKAMKEIGASARRVEAIVSSHTAMIEESRKRLEAHDERQLETGKIVTQTAVKIDEMVKTLSRVGAKTDENAEGLAGVKATVESLKPGTFWSSDNGGLALKAGIFLIIGLIGLAGYNIALP